MCVACWYGRAIGSAEKWQCLVLQPKSVEAWMRGEEGCAHYHLVCVGCVLLYRFAGWCMGKIDELQHHAAEELTRVSVVEFAPIVSLKREDR